MYTLTSVSQTSGYHTGQSGGMRHNAMWHAEKLKNSTFPK